MHRAASALVAIAALSSELVAQSPTYSIGQPPIWRHHAAVQGTAFSSTNERGATFTYGLFHSLNKPPIAALNPVLGVIGGTVEAYGTMNGLRDAGARALVTSRLLALSAGADWDARSHNVDALISWQAALRRGGLMGRGSMLRVDWLPARDQEVRVGISAPLFDPLAGRTRSRTTQARLPESPSQELPLADGARPGQLRQMETAFQVIAAHSNLYGDADVSAIGTMDYRVATQQAARAIGELFRSVDTARVASLTRAARRALLDRVVIPVDSLFGRPKRVDVYRLERAAATQFAAWLSDSSGMTPADQRVARAAFETLVAGLAPTLRRIVYRARDSRLVWFPLDLVLQSDEFDDQAEVDLLIGRVVGRPFTDRNALTYMRNTDLSLEVARSILDARAYHVLWTHEFMGRLWNTRAIDDIGFQMVADAYLPALIAAVKRYDSTGVMPTYMILHDQFYYETSDGRLWMTILENPLGASMRLEGDGGTRERHLRGRQAELRAAVAASPRLQRDAAATGNATEWLRRTVKVHVNVTQPSDFSFRSRHIIPGIPFAPDNLMRDHRKLVIYDVNEAEPNRGGMFVMGIGIGEVYSSAGWEDRGYRVRGPVTLEARAALCRALSRNGFAEAQIPAPLRAVASARAREEGANLKDFIGRALLVNNEVGFGDKKASVTRAVLYNLAGAGSVIVVPDQLWYSETWAGMLAGAAARGARVSIIAPALANSPIPDPPAIARTYDVLLRLIQLRRSLAPRLQASQGNLRIGLFAAQAQANDAAGRLREVREGLARSPWIREVIPFSEKTLAVLSHAELSTANDGPDATHVAKDEKPHPPQPHRKTQLVARAGAISALLSQPGWEEVLADAMRVQSQQTATFAEQLGRAAPPLDTAATRRADEMLHGFEASIPEADRKRMSFYFAEGSQNMNDRSLMSDGEAMLIVSGPQSSAGLADLFFMMARSTWVETQPELERLLPRRSRLVHLFARKVKATL